MEELRPEDIEDLLRELEEEYGAQKPTLPDVEALLRGLQAESFDKRSTAVKRLAALEESSPEIVQALLAATETDATHTIRQQATESLRAPVHQAILHQHAHLKEATERILRKAHLSEVVSRPPHFRVETLGDTFRIEWRPDLQQRLRSTRVAILLLLVSIYFLVFLPRTTCPLFYALAFGSGYWVLAVFANATRVTAGKEEWLFQRGPLPLPKQRFYVRATRLDPGTCKWVWTDRVEEYKRRSSGSVGSGGSDDALGCLLLLFEAGYDLSSLGKELVVTYKLYARCVDGSDQELLPLLEQGEAEYLELALQNQLDGLGGLPPQQ